MQKRTLGPSGPEVSALGLGCMGMSWAYGPTDEAESLQVLSRAFELGVTFWDTAEAYGPFRNEDLLGKAFRSVARSKIFLATKFSNTSPDNSGSTLASDPQHIRKAVEGSLKRLHTDHIDLYYQHRFDPHTPVEETILQLSELVGEGKIRYIGLSEVSANTIRKAHEMHPITAVQSEYSLWERGVEESILPTLKELGIGFVPYSPLGRGFLTGTIKKHKDLAPGDRRLVHPRFQDENLKHNYALVEAVKKIATKNHVTPGQVALAWLLKQGEHIVPIPGTSRIKHLEENAAAAAVKLDAASWASLDKEIHAFKTFGERYPESGMKSIDR